MKNIAFILLFLCTLAFGGLYVWERGKSRAAEMQVANLTQALDELESRAKEQEDRAASLQTRLQNTRETAIAKADEVAQLQQVITNQAEASAKAENPLANMFKSPEMKELVKTQQKTMFSGVIDKSYGAYFNGLQMTPEQATNLKDLFMKKSMVDANLGLSMLGGDTDAAARKEMMDQAKAEKDSIDAEIKQFLGDQNFEQFQAYEKTIPERMSLSMYKDQHTSGPGALTPDQEEKLVQMMSEERRNFKFTTDFNDQSKMNEDFATMLTEEKINQFQVEREQLDKQYMARAKTMLTAEQIPSFEQFLEGQRNMQSAAMKMAGKMFAPKSGGK